MSPNSKFTAVVPKTVQAGDKVLIKGQVADAAQEFSINFVNENCSSPQNITYHFKWILTANVIVENYKENGYWMDHKETNYNAFDGPDFALEFAFNDDGIFVYLVNGDARNIITEYEPEFPLSDIEAIQVWGDVMKINQLTFLYT